MSGFFIKQSARAKEQGEYQTALYRLVVGEKLLGGRMQHEPGREKDAEVSQRAFIAVFRRQVEASGKHLEHEIKEEEMQQRVADDPGVQQDILIAHVKIVGVHKLIRKSESGQR